MSTDSRKLTRAESARINGAKSKGPKTPEGLFRSQTASLQHGLYATRNYILPGESTREFAEFQHQLHAFWQPKGFQDQLLVEELVGVLWESKRLHAAKNDYVYDHIAIVARNAPLLADQAKLNLLAEIEVSVGGGKIERLNARLAHLARERSRLQRDLLTIKKSSCISGGSQMSLEINVRQHPDIPATADPKPVEGTVSEAAYVVEVNDAPPVAVETPEQPVEPVPEPPTIIDWAAVALDFHPDEFQAEVLTESSNRILILGPRQTGKSTAVAVRVIHEAVANDDALILLASASGRQSGQIMEKARQMARRLDLEVLPPPPKCDGFSLANGSRIVALPDSEETIRGFSAPSLIVVDEAAFASESVIRALEPMLIVSSGTFILLSTPNGQSGYFYDQWHADPSPWKKLLGSIERCPRIDPAALEQMRQSLPAAVFAQEFECKFVAAGGQIFNLDMVRQCYRTDFPLFFPEYDLNGGQ